jgi:subtilase family serine protease
MRRLRTRWLLSGCVAAAATAAAIGAASSSGAHGTMAPYGMRPTQLLPLANAFRHGGGPGKDGGGTGGTPAPTGPYSLPCHPGFVCYSPDQLRTAYGMQPFVRAGFDGRGETIVLVDAYGSPSISDDLATFSDAAGLPQADFQQVAPNGVDPLPPDGSQDGWIPETSFDVEWAHAIAPGAKIRLVVGKSADDNDLVDAVQYAVDHNLGDVVSMSFGEAEQCVSKSLLNRFHQLLQRGVSRGITFVAATGDSGPAQVSCDGQSLITATAYPATDPNVTAVGGTDLVADPTTGAYQSESVWNDSAIFGGPAAGGGGPSALFRAPGYQRPATHDAQREVPDVSYDAGFFHTTVGIVGGGPYHLAGTSISAPQWAGVIAILGQFTHRRLGNINPALYLLAKLPPRQNPFHDVADGSDNGFPGFPGYTAVRGYDMATGLGSPNFANLVNLVGKVPPGLTPEDDR